MARRRLRPALALACALALAAPAASGAAVYGATQTFPVGSVSDSLAFEAQPDGRGHLLVLSEVDRDGALSLALSLLPAGGGPNPPFPTPAATVARLTAAPQNPHVLAVATGGSIAIWETLTTPMSTAEQLVAVRVRANGRIDRSWGDAGRVVMPLRGLGLNRFAVDPHGRLLLGGQRGDHALVMRLTAAGDPDRAFAGGGWSDPAANTVVSSLGVDTNSRPVIAETLADLHAGTSTLEVRRLTPGGSLDSAFGGAGTVTVGGPEQSLVSAAPLVAVGPRNVTLVAYNDATGAHFARLTVLGHFDAGFGSDGTVLVAPAAACSATSFDELTAMTSLGATAIYHTVGSCAVPIVEAAQLGRAAAFCELDCAITAIAVNGSGTLLPDPGQGFNRPNDLGPGLRYNSVIALPTGGIVIAGQDGQSHTGPGYESDLYAHVEAPDAGGEREWDLNLGGAPDDSPAGLDIVGPGRAMLVGSAFASLHRSLAVVAIGPSRSGRAAGSSRVLAAIRAGGRGHELAVMGTTVIGQRVVAAVVDRCSTADVQPAGCLATDEHSMLVAITPAGRIDKSFGSGGRVELAGDGDRSLAVFATSAGLMVLRTARSGSSEVTLVSRSGRLVPSFGVHGSAPLGDCDSLPPTAAWLARAARLVIVFDCGGTRSAVVSLPASGRGAVTRELATANVDTRVAPGARGADAAFARLDGGLAMIDAQAHLRPLGGAGTIEHIVGEEGFASGLAWDGADLLVAGTLEKGDGRFRAVVAKLAVTATAPRIQRTTLGPIDSQPSAAPAVSPAGGWLVGGRFALTSLPGSSLEPAAFFTMTGR